MNRLQNSDLLLNALRGELSADQLQEFRKQIAADPELHARWEEELALSRSLESLPVAPVSSNFTARVMQEVRRSPHPPASRMSWIRRLHLSLPRVATVVSCFAVAGVVFYQNHLNSSRERLARSAIAFNEVTGVIADRTRTPAQTLPVDLLQDFDAIQKLNQVPTDGEVDTELLLALEK